MSFSIFNFYYYFLYRSSCSTADIRYTARQKAVQSSEGSATDVLRRNYTAGNTPSPSFPPFGSPIFGEVDDDAESSDADCAESRPFGNHGGTRLASARLAALAAVPSKSEEPRASTALQEPISLKRKVCDAEDPPSPAMHALPPRSPLTPRNLQDTPVVSFVLSAARLLD
ncbi:hypothetical protein B0H12DRAFT_1137356 [Mycena haematopus]|nr:hypothetical protein B0H12DRAFT_1137356 [Mycena haematopus]